MPTERLRYSGQIEMSSMPPSTMSPGPEPSATETRSLTLLPAAIERVASVDSATLRTSPMDTSRL